MRLAIILAACVAAAPADAIKFKESGKAAGVDDPAVNGTGPAFADYDQDGDVDIFVSTEAIGPGIALRLWDNDGRGKFRDVAKLRGIDSPGTLGRGAAWGDYDNDGDLDLIITTMEQTGGPGGAKPKQVPSTLFKNLLAETGTPN